MAGIGVRLNRIFEKNTLTTDFLGFAYSTVATIAPDDGNYYFAGVYGNRTGV